jgi:hypothetical protein
MEMPELLKEVFPGKSPSEESMEKLLGMIKEAPTSRDLYSQLKGTGMDMGDIVKALEQTSYNLGKDRIIRDGLFPKRTLADPMSSGYVMRAAKEFENYAKQRSRNKKLAIAAGLAGLLGVGAYNVFSDNKPKMQSPQDLMQRFSALLETGYVTAMKKRSTLESVAGLAAMMTL